MCGTTAASAPAIARLRSAIAARLGLAVSEERTGPLLDLLERRCRATRLHAAEYLAWLEQDAGDDEVQALGQALTISETHFFRDADQFQALSESVLPERVRARRSEQQLRLLSLGCASGEEAYSLAIVARTVLPNSAWHLTVTGIDVNRVALEKARAGRYSSWSLRATPHAHLTRWFRPSGDAFVLDEAIRSAVRLEQGNLVAEHASWRIPSYWDVVFLRNVLMYFTPEQARELVNRVEQMLAPGGYLFVGHAESLRGVSEAYELKHTHGTFYYRRPSSRAHVGRMSTSDTGRVASQRGLSGAVSGQPRTGSTYAAGPSATREHRIPRADASTVGSAILEQALGLLAREEFGKAEALLASLPTTAQSRPEITLVRGVSLLQQGHVELAMDLARTLLASHEGHAGGHHLLALCLEAAGDMDAAVRQWQACVRLEPAGGLAHLHLGRLSRRAGDLATATKALSAALVLLPMDTPFSLLLFGGGFTPAALLNLCQAELTRCGVQHD